MAVRRHSNFDITVNTIIDRNNITKKVNGMIVTVLDAISDINVGVGSATYRWDTVKDSGIWVLIQKDSSTDNGSSTPFLETDIIFKDNYNIQSGKNALIVGPFILDNGATINIPEGSRLVVV